MTSSSPTAPPVAPQVSIPLNYRAPNPSLHTRVLPGFRSSLSLTLLYLSLMVLIPLAALIAKPWEHGLDGFISVATDERVLASLRLSFVTALAAATLNLFVGLVIAWVLTRYQFPGVKILDAFVDLPFALPTAVAGVALCTLYAPNGWIGQLFAPFDIQIAYTPIGIFVALVFVGLPFVVRSVQPVLADFDAEVEEAARTLGASPWQTAARVILPGLAPSLLTGFSLALARAVGEYGSVIFISSNMPYVSEIAPQLIVIKLQEFDYAGAASVGLLMLLMSFTILIVINAIQVWLFKRGRA